MKKYLLNQKLDNKKGINFMLVDGQVWKGSSRE